MKITGVRETATVRERGRRWRWSVPGSAALTLVLTGALTVSLTEDVGVAGVAGVPGVTAVGQIEQVGAPTPAQYQVHQRPVPGEVIRAADIPDDNWLPGHRGVDLDAAPGQTVAASAAGQIHFAGTVAGTPLVSVDHGDGMRTTYEPVNAVVATGDIVTAGEIIGVLADTDDLAAGARRDEGLSWGARVGDRYLDPMDLLAPVTVRLWE